MSLIRVGMRLKLIAFINDEYRDWRRQKNPIFSKNRIFNGNAIKLSLKYWFYSVKFPTGLISLRGFRPVGNFHLRVSGNPRSGVPETTDNHNGIHGGLYLLDAGM
jgi:hypothetical protein